MNLHSNARLPPFSRTKIVHRVLDLQQPVANVAAAFSVSSRTVFKWLARFRAEGAVGLHDRSSRPQRPAEPPILCRWRVSSPCAAASCRASRSPVRPTPPRPPSRTYCAAIVSAWPNSLRRRPSDATNAPTPAISPTPTSRSWRASHAPAIVLSAPLSAITSAVPVGNTSKSPSTITAVSASPSFSRIAGSFPRGLHGGGVCHQAPPAPLTNQASTTPNFSLSYSHFVRQTAGDTGKFHAGIVNPALTQQPGDEILVEYWTRAVVRKRSQYVPEPNKIRHRLLPARRAVTLSIASACCSAGY